MGKSVQLVTKVIFISVLVHIGIKLLTHCLRMKAFLLNRDHLVLGIIASRVSSTGRCPRLMESSLTFNFNPQLYLFFPTFSSLSSWFLWEPQTAVV